MPVDSRPSSGAAAAASAAEGADAVELIGVYERLWKPRPENEAL